MGAARCVRAEMRWMGEGGVARGVRRRKWMRGTVLGWRVEGGFAPWLVRAGAALVTKEGEVDCCSLMVICWMMMSERTCLILSGRGYR